MNKKLKATMVAGVTVVLAACGGGGGQSAAVPAASSYLSGTAAGGAALVGNVIVTDSKGAVKSGPIAADGKYTIDVSGMTGPFVLKAAGTVGNTAVTYYSAATAADLGGTVNVTPFTDLIVSNIAAQMAVNYFNDPANVAKIGTLINSASLAAAETALQAKLQPVLTAMGLGASVDLLHQAFATDHSGLDAVLDLVKVSTNSATNVATLTNALTQMVIGTNNAAAAALDATPVDAAAIAGINAGTATNLQTVTAHLNALAALFATSLPSVAAIQNSGLFDTSGAFLLDGQNFLQFATSLANNPEAIGMKFSNASVALDASGTAGTVAAALSSNSANFGGHITLNVLKDPTKGWLVEGNGHIANMGLEARAQLDYWSQLASANQSANAGTNMLNGIHVYIDPFVYNSGHSTAMVVSAVVSGPGLPAAGINMAQDAKNTWFDVTAYGTNNGQDLIPECNTPIYSTNGTVNATGQCVDVAQALDNSVYTVVLKDSNGNSLNGAGETLTLAKQPLFYKDLKAAQFPTITSMTINGQALTPSLVTANASLAVAWSMPAGLTPDHVDMWANTSTGSSYLRAQQNGLGSSATQTLLALGTPLLSTSGTVNNVGVWLASKDVFRRRFATSRSINQ